MMRADGRAPEMRRFALAAKIEEKELEAFLGNLAMAGFRPARFRSLPYRGKMLEMQRNFADVMNPCQKQKKARVYDGKN